MSLKELIQTGRDERPSRIFGYGVPGVGKTSFAAGAPSPVFIPTEEGFGRTLDVPRFPLCRTYADVLNAIDMLLSEEHDYETVIIDTADDLERLIWAEVAREHAGEGKSIEDIGYAKGYIFALKWWEEILNGLDALRDIGITPVLLGHALVKEFKSPDTENYDRYRPDLHDKAASLIRGWADVILFMNYRVFIKKTDSKQQSGSKKATGQGERVIFTQERPAFWAKNRDNLPFEIPLVHPGGWDLFASYLYGNAEHTEEKDVDEKQTTETPAEEQKPPTRQRRSGATNGAASTEARSA